MPTIFVEPRISKVRVGQQFSIDINVRDVESLFAWEFKLYFDPALLDIDIINEGGFLGSVGGTYFVVGDTFVVSPLLVGCALFKDSASGEGTLATITFKAIARGKGNLELFDSQLIDSNINPIRHNARDGSFNIK